MEDEKVKKKAIESRRQETRDAAMELPDGREYEIRELSDEEFMRRLNEQDGYSALPAPPKMDGWHYKWASTTNAHDNVHADTKLGYVPVKMHEIPGFFHDPMKSGMYEGCIACNEMILMKIPENRYQMIMTKNHHDMPLQMEAAVVEQARQKLQIGGKSLMTDVDDGMSTLGKASKKPVF